MSKRTFTYPLKEDFPMLVVAAVIIIVYVFTIAIALSTMCPDGYVRVSDPYVSECIPYEEWKNK